MNQCKDLKEALGVTLELGAVPRNQERLRERWLRVYVIAKEFVY